VNKVTGLAIFFWGKGYRAERIIHPVIGSRSVTLNSRRLNQQSEKNLLRNHYRTAEAGPIQILNGPKDKLSVAGLGALPLAPALRQGSKDIPAVGE
jgi:hypothetical protein